MWKVLKQLTHGNNRESPPDTLTADIFNSYFTKQLQVLMVVKVNCYGEDQTAHVVFIFTTIEQYSVKEHLLKLGDVTNNDVLGFDSRLLFLSAEIIAHILTKYYNVSIETQSVISDWKLSKVTLYIIWARVARMMLVTEDL